MLINSSHVSTPLASCSHELLDLFNYKANTNTSLVEPYDLIALLPTTSAATFSLAYLTHSLPSLLTAHIIALPLTLPRLLFHFEAHSGAIGRESDGSGDSEANVKRNWWAAAREVARVTKGKSIVVSEGVASEADYRGPKDIVNLQVHWSFSITFLQSLIFRITLLDLAQHLAHDASTVVPKSLILRAQARKTYRAVLSEPRLVIPEAAEVPLVQPTKDGQNSRDIVNSPQTSHLNPTSTLPQSDHPTPRDPLDSKKRPCAEDDPESTTNGRVNSRTGEVALTDGESSGKSAGNREKAGRLAITASYSSEYRLSAAVQYSFLFAMRHCKSIVSSAITSPSVAALLVLTTRV
ncbi:hypothetical protein AZE42_12158 [Rhizopogon vesiculosus]|uniref:Uncharacterized protein n=1 Tax=Rhizopogon vesiculosus TaxID=180088 RepID=A0A1J8R577_9AGAM|nr:hypothetical protein AZE42_12158 [Rhizopogon vesiculosus]